MAVGGRGAPRVRLTWIHAGIAAFIAVAFLSVVIDARYLSDTLELVLGVKKLFLLVTYGLVFLIVASCIRREEVPAYLKLMLWCAVICSLGIIFEYRSHTNLFYSWTDKLLPGIFRVDHVDDVVRRDRPPVCDGSRAARARGRGDARRWRSRSRSSACCRPSARATASCTRWRRS